MLGSLQAVHLATNGVAVAKLAALVPQASGVVGVLLNPWAALGIVVVSTLVAMGVVLVRLLREPADDVEVETVEGDAVPDEQAQRPGVGLGPRHRGAARQRTSRASKPQEQEPVDPLDGVDGSGRCGQEAARARGA